MLLRTVERDDDEDENLADFQRSGFFQELVTAIRYAEPGAFRAMSVSFETVKAVIRTHNSLPVVIRTTGIRDMIDRDRLPNDRSYWFDRLALEAAIVGRDEGRLVVYYPHVGAGDRFLVYDNQFPKHRADDSRGEAAPFPIRGPGRPGPIPGLRTRLDESLLSLQG